MCYGENKEKDKPLDTDEFEKYSTSQVHVF